MTRTLEYRTYLAWRRPLCAFAFLVVLVAALFGVHTPSVGYDDDDPNRVSLIADYPRLALNSNPLRRRDRLQTGTSSQRPATMGKPAPPNRNSAAVPDNPTPDDVLGGAAPGLPLAVLPRAHLATGTRRPTSRHESQARPRAPPILA